MEPGTNCDTLLRELESDIKKYQSDVKEIHEKQEMHLQTLDEIKSKMSTTETESIDQLMQIVKVYTDKVHKLSNRMMDLHSKAKNMKEQSLRIQQMAIEKRANQVEKRFYEENLIRKNPIN